MGKMIDCIAARHRFENNQDFDWLQWRVKLCWDFPVQHNSFDCGVFAIKAVQSIVFGESPHYNQK
jgi:Ulp1 family protease